MTVQVEAPTGREVRAHIERWRELPEGERPEFQVEKWNNSTQEWQGIRYVISNFPDDDTPQPGLRLVPLPVPVEAPETEWVPQVGDRVLVEGKVVGGPDSDGDYSVRSRLTAGDHQFFAGLSSLRPFPEDGEA